VLDKYRNLSATKKGVKEDIEQRALVLFGEQQREAENLELVKDAIEAANEKINKKLTIADFQRLIDAEFAVKDIIREINKRADLVWQAENPPEPEPIKEEPTPEVPIEQPVTNTFAPAVDEPVFTQATEDIRFVQMRVTATKGKILLLSQYLNDNGYKYEVLDKGKVNE
jgi:hypothetical protein